MFVLSVLEAPNTKTNSLCVQTHLAIKLFQIHCFFCFICRLMFLIFNRNGSAYELGNAVVAPAEKWLQNATITVWSPAVESRHLLQNLQIIIFNIL